MITTINSLFFDECPECSASIISDQAAMRIIEADSISGVTIFVNLRDSARLANRLDEVAAQLREIAKGDAK